MLSISPNFDVKSVIFSQFWPVAFSKIAGKSPEVRIVEDSVVVDRFYVRLF